MSEKLYCAPSSRKIALVQLDDIYIYMYIFSHARRTYIERTRHVLNLLQEAGTIIKLVKYTLLTNEVDYLYLFIRLY